MATVDELTALMLAIELTEPYPLIGELVFSGLWQGKVYSKGRPRFGNGHAFTPPNTRKFESKLKKWYHAQIHEPVEFPCKVELTLYDPMPKSASKKKLFLMENELIFSGVGDIDNREKAILDAGNGILFVDDKQIVESNTRRVYDHISGFHIKIFRAGLSEQEAAAFGEL